MQRRHHLLIFSVVLLIWQLLVMIFKLPKQIMPSPLDVLISLIDNFQLLAIHTAYTTVEAILGLVIAIIIGVLVAILFNQNERVRAALVPYISSMQTIPGIVIAPLFAIWFGFGLFPKVLLITIFCSFPIIVGTLSGFNQVDSETVDYMRTLKLSDYQMYRLLYIPASLQSFFSSLRISATYAIVNAIFAEYMGAKYGLGVYLNRASSSFDTAKVFTAIIAIIAVTQVLLYVVNLIEKKVIKWS